MTLENLRGGEAARLVRRHGRRELGGDDVAHLRDHVGIRGRLARADEADCERKQGRLGEATPADRKRS